MSLFTRVEKNVHSDFKEVLLRPVIINTCVITFEFPNPNKKSISVWSRSLLPPHVWRMHLPPSLILCKYPALLHWSGLTPLQWTNPMSVCMTVASISWFHVKGSTH